MNKELRIHLWFMLVASFCFAMTGALARYFKPDYSSVQLVFLRNCVGFLYIFYVLVKTPPKQSGGRILLLLNRGLIGTLALYIFFYGVHTIGLPEAITYQQSYPILLALVSWYFLNEKISSKTWIAIVIGFIGLLLIFVPKMSGEAKQLNSVIIGISNLIMTGIAYLSIRGLSSYYDHRVIIFSFISFGVLLPLVSHTLSYFVDLDSLDFIITRFRPIQTNDIPLLIAFGIVALLGQVFLTKAFAHPNTGMIGAIGYSNVVFSIFFGIILGDKIPSLISTIGIFLIILSGVLISITKDIKGKGENKI